MPSAFIPFCAYQTSLLLLGEFINSFEFPVCNKFTPTVLDGQLCYNLGINSVLSERETMDGKGGELMLLLDYNKEKSIHPIHLDRQIVDNNTHISLEDTPNKDDLEARIFIHTLKTFSGYGEGAYTMNSLKQVSTTGSFLQLPFDVKGCTNDDKENCRMKKYLEKGRQECGCIPWEYPEVSEAKVG